MKGKGETMRWVGVGGRADRNTLGILTIINCLIDAHDSVMRIYTTKAYVY